MSAVVFPRRKAIIRQHQAARGVFEGLADDTTFARGPIALVDKKIGYSPWPAVWRIPVTPLTIAADLTVIPGILLLVIFVSG